MNLFKQKFLRVPHLSFLESLMETSRNPFVDWIIIIIFSIVFVIVLIFVNINLYQRVISGNIKGKDINNDIIAVSFNQKDLDLIIKKFDLKESIQSQIKKGYTGTANPGI